VNHVDLQDSIDKLYSWCSLNKLQLNIDKCKKISFTRKTEVISFNFNVNGSLLARCNEISDLGVIMDTGLTFVPHMRSVVNKALKMLGFIFRNTSDFTNTISIKSLFYAFVRSKLEYCSVVWMPYNQVYISLLEKIQRKFAKYMYFKIHGHYPMQHCDESIPLKSVD
jgi:hypothetical protein